MAIRRTFSNIPDGKLDQADNQAYLVSLGWLKTSGWDDLLRAKRILIISETGAGKTYECRTQQRRLWDAGEPAFFLELATLASSDIHSMLSPEQQTRFDAWRISQSDVATFFLDSIDELKISQGSFEQALIRLSKAISGQLARARIVITTRPVPFDEQLVRRLLPIPPPPAPAANGDTFAQIAMGTTSSRPRTDEAEAAASWRTVALMPLSDEQIAEFARIQGVDDPQALLTDVQRRSAEVFARRPLDLIELCADWREYKRIGTHRDQVASNVRIKLKPRDDRRELTDLSGDKAIEGASRLALAMVTTRRLTIRHSTEADVGGKSAALDPAIILTDWMPAERKTLLERALFGFASYGRVRFHHRSVMEYLAAERINALRARGMTTDALKRLLFMQFPDKIILRPALRPVAGWLSLSENVIFEMLRDHEPATLLNDGDPESLTTHQRTRALRAYAERYGQGGRRGLRVPDIQIHRFASPALAEEINRLWATGIQNTEIRVTLLQLIETGAIVDCADIAYAVALDASAPGVERIYAIAGLIACDHSRISDVTNSITNDAPPWPNDLMVAAVLRLFPNHLSVEDLRQVLMRAGDTRQLFSLSSQLPDLILRVALDHSTLRALRDSLVALLSAGIAWRPEWPHIVADRSHLANVLVATCLRGLTIENTDDWLQACVLALGLPKTRNGADELRTQLHGRLANLQGLQISKLFWFEDALHQSLHPTADPVARFRQIAFRGATQLDSTRDGPWIKDDLADRTRSLPDRAMLLHAAMKLYPNPATRLDHLRSLEPLVADQAELLLTLEVRLSKTENSIMETERRASAINLSEEQDEEEATAHRSWVEFWQKLVEQPNDAFSDANGDDTVWNLWRAMRHAGDNSRESGWSRRFIEAHFNKDVADRVRANLMQRWRNDRPALPSERSELAKHSFSDRWLLGLAGIYAESEDQLWATKLSVKEAALASRYAIYPSGLPLWIEALANVHSAAVDATLGEELTFELNCPQDSPGISMLLQSINQASNSVIAIFLPRLAAWLDAYREADDASDSDTRRLAQVIDVLLQHGDDAAKESLRNRAEQRLRENAPARFASIWLPTLLRLDASAGVEALELLVSSIAPSAHSEAVTLLAALFGTRGDNIDLSGLQSNPLILLKLLRLYYHHVRPADDVTHIGTFSPDGRYHAERGRRAIENGLLNTVGEEGWTAKVEMASDPLFAHFKDRILAIAEERWAAERDAVPFNDAQAVALDKTCDAPATTNDAMFAIMVGRLNDIDELLLSDTSPREHWSKIDDEHVMRRAIALELTHRAKNVYKITQEEVTGEEKETDIRMLSSISDHVAVIELKLADRRTANDLLGTIQDQLVTKYMAPDMRKAGCLLITLAKKRTWNHPTTGVKIELAELVQLLKDEATRVTSNHGGTICLHVHTLDLRVRLLTEAKAKNAKAKSAKGKSAKGKSAATGKIPVANKAAKKRKQRQAK